MRILLLTIVALAACSKGDWKERKGDGYVVTGPYSPKRQEQSAGAAGTLTIFEYGNGKDYALQVQTMPLPADTQETALAGARDQVIADADNGSLREGRRCL